VLLLVPPINRLVVNFFSKRLAAQATVHQASVTIEGNWTEVSPAQGGSRPGEGADNGLPPGVTRH
jgi:hypothetical protein